MTVENLSHLTHGPTGGESMNPTNMISEPPPFGAPGSYSEATANEPVGRPAGADYPAPQGPSVLEDGGQGQGYSPWTGASPGGWNVAADDAGREAGGWVTP